MSKERFSESTLSENGTSYAELMKQFGLPTGKLNYQLRQLVGLIEKNGERRYVLTPLGRRAVALLRMVNQDINPTFKSIKGCPFGAEPSQIPSEALNTGLDRIIIHHPHRVWVFELHRIHGERYYNYRHSPLSPSSLSNRFPCLAHTRLQGCP